MTFSASNIVPSCMMKQEINLYVILFSKFMHNFFIKSIVVRVSGYRYSGLGFDSRRYQIF